MTLAQELAITAPALVERSRRLAYVTVGLIVANVLAWDMALTAANGSVAFLATALLAYGLGLRHAVDADHIAAIDNATRRLMQRGDKPVAIGLFFALGHSSVVFVACAAMALGPAWLRGRVPHLDLAGAWVGTAVSVGFLFVIGAANLVTLIGIWRAYRAQRSASNVIVLPVAGGLAPRLLGPLMRIITRSWHMVPLGLLFGLGFDTASEAGLLTLGAAQAAHHASPWALIALPLLFAAGMSLVDTADGALMVGAYGWAFVQPMRKLGYNLIVTLISVVAALVVGSLEVVQLTHAHPVVAHGVWRWIALANQHFGIAGVGIIVTLTGCWAVSALATRLRRPEATPPGAQAARPAAIPPPQTLMPQRAGRPGWTRTSNQTVMSGRL